MSYRTDTRPSNGVLRQSRDPRPGLGPCPAPSDASTLPVAGDDAGLAWPGAAAHEPGCRSRAARQRDGRACGRIGCGPGRPDHAGDADHRAAPRSGSALRVYCLLRPGYLLGVTEYDDGSYFGSALRLVARPAALPGLRLRPAAGHHAADDARGAAGQGHRHRPGGWRIGRILTVLAGTAEHRADRAAGPAPRRAGRAWWPAGSAPCTRTPSSPRTPCSSSRGWCCSA